MNLVLFNELVLRKPWQQATEWRLFLEFVAAYFHNRGITRPVVVELGVGMNRQKVFYEQLLGARHIGVDNLAERQPDILGDTADPKTKELLQDMLGDDQINLLFIDAGHDYADVKRDYEIYGPMTRNIVVLHDIITMREEVRLFWRHLITAETPDIAKITFVTNRKLYGIGLLVME